MAHSTPLMSSSSRSSAGCFPRHDTARGLLQGEASVLKPSFFRSEKPMGPSWVIFPAVLRKPVLKMYISNCTQPYPKYISNYTPTCHSSPLSVTPTTGTDRTSKPAKKTRCTGWLHDIEGVNKSGCQLESGQIMNFQTPNCLAILRRIRLLFTTI